MEYIIITTKDIKSYNQECPKIINIDRIVINLNNIARIETYTCTDEQYKGKKGIILHSLDRQKYIINEDYIVETNSSIINSLRGKNTIMTL